MTDMTDWQPIDTYEQDLWNGDVVLLRDENGNEKVGTWEYEDSCYDSETGEELGLYGAWHDEDSNALGFEPTHWKPDSKSEAGIEP